MFETSRRNYVCQHLVAGQSSINARNSIWIASHEVLADVIQPGDRLSEGTLAIGEVITHPLAKGLLL